MLFTRCPECTTTFRVSDEALQKANGQVRCGRCASVFNAVTEQVEGDERPAQPASNAAPATTAVPFAAPSSTVLAAALLSVGVEGATLVTPMVNA